MPLATRIGKAPGDLFVEPAGADAPVPVRPADSPALQKMRDEAERFAEERQRRIDENRAALKKRIEEIELDRVQRQERVRAVHDFLAGRS